MKILFENTNIPVNAKIKMNYLSLERLKSYLYKITFDTLPKDVLIDTPIGGACTSFVKDGKLYRNLDWGYDNIAEFKVICKGFKGMAFIPGLNDGKLNEYLLSQLPYHINDGINEDGIMVSSHVLFNDWEFKGSGTKSVSLTKIPYIVLSTLHSMNDISSLQAYLNNIQVNAYLQKAEYLMQFLVTDGTTTYVITPGEYGYELVDISALPQLTNFKWINKAAVELTDEGLQTRPTGIERWNAIADDATLEDLRFTLAYESADRLSEFIGEGNTTKSSTTEELTAIYNLARAEYLQRKRDGKTWHTMHSVIYSSAGMEELYTQENFKMKEN